MSIALSQHLPLLAAAQTGIQKLRVLILELAMRGKLAPQDPGDEPASELMKGIAQERARLEAEGVCKKLKAVSTVGQQEQPFAIPPGWVWTRLGLVTNISTGGLDANAATPDGEFPFFTCSKIVSRIDHYSYDTDAVLLAGNGDFNIKFYSGKFNAYQRTYVIEPIGIALPYLYRAICQNIAELTKHNRGSAIPYLKIGDLTHPPFPVPPLAEQYRIAARVDELMALCDRLEMEQTNAESAHSKLVDTLLATLTESADADEFGANWQRLAEHFDTLFSTEYSIDALKQSILKLAVMGKLERQDLDDVRRDNPQSDLECSRSEMPGRKDEHQKTDIPFPLPAGWRTARLDDIATVISGNAFKSEDFRTPTGIRAIKIANVGVGRFLESDDFLPGEFGRSFEKFSVNSGDILIALTRPYITNGLKVCLCPESYDQALLNQRVGAIKINQSKAIASFVYLYLSSSFALEYVTRKTRTLNQPNLNIPDLRNLVVPLPPLAEQHRIVARVDELTALCDRLKTDLAESRQHQERLASSLIESTLKAA